MLICCGNVLLLICCGSLDVSLGVVMDFGMEVQVVALYRKVRKRTGGVCIVFLGVGNVVGECRGFVLEW